MEEYKAENFQEAVENIDNSEFVKAIERMRADYTDDNKNDVMNRAVFDVTYFVPAFRNDNAQLTQGKDNRLSFNENQQARFVLVENPQGEKYIPAFTDHESLLKFRNEQAQGAQGFDPSSMGNMGGAAQQSSNNGGDDVIDADFKDAE